MELKIGDKAPDFSGINQDGKEVALSKFKGQKLILYFYPKDATPGCTAEACDFRDNYRMWQQKGYSIVGVSPDTPQKHRSFATDNHLDFDLVSDPEKKIMQLYNAWGEKKLYGKTYLGVLRTTFVIDEQGRIGHIFKKVNTKSHSKQILDTLE